MYTYTFDTPIGDDGRLIKIDNAINNVDFTGSINADAGEFGRLRVRNLYADNYYFDATGSDTLTSEIDKLKTEIDNLKTQVRDEISVELYKWISKVNEMINGEENAGEYKSSVIADPYGKVR